MIIFFSLLFSAFFSGMEIAFISVNKLRVELERRQGNFFSNIIVIFSKNPGQYIATMLVGNNIALVIYGIFFAKLIEPLIEQYITTTDYGILIIQTFISTLIILITAEFLPKTIFKRNSNRFLHAFSPIVLFFYIIFYPIAGFTVFFSNTVLKYILKVKIDNKNNNENVFGKIELGHLLSEDKKNKYDDNESDTEIKIFRNALGFSEIKVRECIVPRNEIKAVDISSNIRELSKMFIETGYSRILIYENSIDNIIGFVHTLDIFKGAKTIRETMINILIVPETMLINELLNIFIKEHKSVALVVDEFGGTSGMITLEDIIEEIFGEIEDEHDTINLSEEKISETEYKLSGRLEIDYLNDKYKFELPESQEYETLAGYIFFIKEQIPEVNEVIIDANFKFEILETKGPKIETVKLIIDS